MPDKILLDEVCHVCTSSRCRRAVETFAFGQGYAAYIAICRDCLQEMLVFADKPPRSKFESPTFEQRKRELEEAGWDDVTEQFIETLDEIAAFDEWWEEEVNKL